MKYSELPKDLLPVHVIEPTVHKAVVVQRPRKPKPVDRQRDIWAKIASYNPSDE